MGSITFDYESSINQVYNLGILKFKISFGTVDNSTSVHYLRKIGGNEAAYAVDLALSSTTSSEYSEELGSEMSTESTGDNLS